MQSLKTSLVLTALCIGQIGFAQLNNRDLAVIKLYPPTQKKMINLTNFAYTSKHGASLTYQVGEGEIYVTKADSLAAINKLGELDSTQEYDSYTDGAINAWVEGNLRIGKENYILYGSYAGEGFLQGALYDKNKNIYGLLEWESGNNITATLKTKTSTIKYNFTNGKENKNIKPAPKVDNSALDAVLANKNIDIPNDNANATGTSYGIATTGEAEKKDVLYLNDLIKLESMSDSDRTKQLIRWGWPIQGKTTIDKEKKHFNIVNQTYGIAIKVEYLYKGDALKSAYKFTGCGLQYVNNFINNAKKLGYKITEDKKNFFRLVSNQSTIIINKTSIDHNEQYFEIEVN